MYVQECDKITYLLPKKKNADSNDSEFKIEFQ